MISLSSATSFTRIFAKWVAIGIGTILVVLIIYRIAILVKQRFTPPAPPTISFGQLPKIQFPQGPTVQSLSFSIDTITGVLPSFSDRATVYKTESPQPNLLALDVAKKKVSGISFDGQGTKLSDELYQWNSNDSSSGMSRKIVFNIFSSDFNLSSSFITNPQVLQGNNLPNETAAKDTASNFLSNLSVMPQDIDATKTTTALLSIENTALVPATSLSNTQVVRVDFFQQDLSGFPIVYPKAKSSTMNVYVGGGSNNPQVVQADFFHQNISSSSATYPILTAQEALSKLKNADAYIASYDGVSKDISIKKIYMGYYLGDQKQDFVEPVVVFEGDKGFTAYVPAVTDEWTQK